MHLSLILLFAGPAVAALFLLRDSRTGGRRFLRRKFQTGAPIIYRVLETSACPSQGAYEVHPAEHGDFYYYLRNRYWRVEEVRADGWIVARTPLMEQHLLRRDDPNLRKPNLLERLRYAARFPCMM